MDEVGFVYEKEAIIDWLSKQQGGGRHPVRAPFAGTALLLCLSAASGQLLWATSLSPQLCGPACASHDVQTLSMSISLIRR